MGVATATATAAAACLRLRSPRIVTPALAMPRPVSAGARSLAHAAAAPLSGAGRDSEPVRIYRYAVDSHGQLFLHDTPVKNIAVRPVAGPGTVR